MTGAGMKLIDVAKTSGRWDAHAATDAMTMPPELKKALNGNAAAKKNWPTYTDSQQKAFLRMVDGAKTAETRARRVARVLEIVGEQDVVLAARQGIDEGKVQPLKSFTRIHPTSSRSRTRPSTLSTTSLIGIVVVSM